MSQSKLNAMRTKLHGALQDLADDLGPRSCPHGDWSECHVEDCEWEDTEMMPGGMLLGEFVLVMSWTTMEEGENFVGVHTAPKQLLSHTNGLLFTALYE